jgi:hypothetical protein
MQFGTQRGCCRPNNPGRQQLLLQPEAPAIRIVTRESIMNLRIANISGRETNIARRWRER